MLVYQRVKDDTIIQSVKIDTIYSGRESKECVFGFFQISIKDLNSRPQVVGQGLNHWGWIRQSCFNWGHD